MDIQCGSSSSENRTLIQPLKKLDTVYVTDDFFETEGDTVRMLQKYDEDIF